MAATPTGASVLNFVYTMNGTFGGMFAKEPVNNNATKVVRWDSTQIKFHYPSEHAIGGKQYDLEMQIYIKDTYI